MATKRTAPAFDLSSALASAEMVDEMSAPGTTGRQRKPSQFDAPLTEARNAGNKVLRFSVPTDAVEDTLKEARSAARYLGFAIQVGKADNGDGTTRLEMKPRDKRTNQKHKTDNK